MRLCEDPDGGCGAIFYENMSELAGVPIHGEYELISMIREMAARKESYEKVRGFGKSDERIRCRESVLKDIELAEPELIHHGNKFGVKIKADLPSIHMIRANIETEITPIVESEDQANDLIRYIKEGRRARRASGKPIFSANPSGELMEDENPE